MSSSGILGQKRALLALGALPAGIAGALVLGLLGGNAAHAIPMAPELMTAKVELPGELADYAIAVDFQDPDIFYVAPRSGRLGMTRSLPEVSFATTERNGRTFGILNAIFDFAIEAETFEAIRTALKQHNPRAKLRPWPFSQTTPRLALAGTNGEVCFDAVDFITGEKMTECIDQVFRQEIALEGPTLGEKLGVSLVLNEVGVDLLPRLLKGGAGLLINLEAVYLAATPAFTAIIDADVAKLYESYAWYAGYHDGICTDISISDFFEKSVLCTNNELDAFGGACSIRVTYRDQHGNQWNNLFDVLPEPTASEEVREWFQTYNERVRALWTAIDGLRVQFETMFLEPIVARKAEVSTEATRGFALRVDRVKAIEEGTWHFERDMLGAVGPKRTVVVGYSVCVDVDGETGAVSKSRAGDCDAYYGGTVSEPALLPVEPDFDRADERAESQRILPWD